MKNHCCPHRIPGWTILLGLLLFIMLAACRPAVLNPPRLETQTAQAAMAPTETPPPLELAAPTATAESADPTLAEPVLPEVTPNQSITLWVDETSQAHARILAEMAQEFTESTNIQLEVVQVSSDLLPELVDTAVLSDTLPDLILHPIEYTFGWAERGILNTKAATEIADQLGRDTFDAGALDMLTTDDGTVVALPSDGWQELIIYRRDWFDERGLAAPNNYDSLYAAAEAIFQPDSIYSGIIIPTDSGLVTTQQAFELIASANGCQLIDQKGEVSLLHPACLEALDYYLSLISQFSPIGVQTDTSALNAYLAGRTGIIFASPAVLPALAGLDEAYPLTCADCTTPNFLVNNSGVLTHLQGSGEFATRSHFGTMSNLGITSSADQEAAAVFANYWFKDGYLKWLSVEPERKVPMRNGETAGSTTFLTAWQTLPLVEGQPSLADIFGQELTNQLAEGVTTTNRWAFPEKQGRLVTSLYTDLTISRLLQEMLSGYFTSSQTIIEMHNATVAFIPNYAYPIEETDSNTTTN
ncbi:MAG: extracellular solute-binding protein [Candidatus Promineifilaceae bacterium]